MVSLLTFLLKLFQYLSKKLGADPVVFGYLQTTFAVVQLCGGPIFGRFGDVFGSRAALVLLTVWRFRFDKIYSVAFRFPSSEEREPRQVRDVKNVGS